MKSASRDVYKRQVQTSGGPPCPVRLFFGRCGRLYLPAGAGAVCLRRYRCASRKRGAARPPVSGIPGAGCVGDNPGYGDWCGKLHNYNFRQYDFLYGGAVSDEDVYKRQAYRSRVVGCYAKREDEPAVYRAMETKSPVRDIRAVTHEERTVRQDVVPISDDDGRLIGVLIGERDISDDIRQEQKYEALVRRAEKGDFIHVSPEDAARREVHHRVKNHLQLIASIMNICLLYTSRCV